MTKRAASSRVFWNMHNLPLSLGRWEIDADDPTWDRVMAWRCYAGKRFRPSEWPKPIPLYKYHNVGIVEDMPASMGQLYIVSDRFKHLLEREVPTSLQFLQVRVIGPSSADMCFSYWAINFLHVWECLDPTAPRNVDRKGREFCPVAVIDAARIPHDGLIGVIKNYEVVCLVRNDLKRNIQRGGMIGPQFSRIAVGQDPLLPPRSPGGARSSGAQRTSTTPKAKKSDAPPTRRARS